MKLRIIGEIKNIDDQKSKAMIRVKQDVDRPLAFHFLTEFYEAIIRSMRDYNEDAFDMAMGKFIDDDYDRLVAKFERELHNED